MTVNSNNHHKCSEGQQINYEGRGDNGLQGEESRLGVTWLEPSATYSRYYRLPNFL